MKSFYLSASSLLFFGPGQSLLYLRLWVASLILLLSLMLAACNEVADTTQRDTNKDTVLQSTGSPVTIDSLDETMPPEEGVDTTRLSPTEKTILNIRREYNRIQQLPLSRQSFGFECDVKDSIHYYLYEGRVLKIVVDWGFVGDGKSQHEYYYSNNRLFFVYKKHVGHVPGGGETVFEQRSYVKGDQTIRYMENGKPAQCVGCTYNKNSREYRAPGALLSKDFRGALCD